MLLDPFKLCLLDATACTTSVTGYFQGTRQASNVLPSADMSFNQDKLDAARKKQGVHAKKPDSVSFNTCFEGNTPKRDDGSSDDDYYAYALALHEAGHALGLSDWTATWTGASLAVSLFNSVVDVLGKLNRVPEELKLEGVKAYTEEEIYKASHPSTPDSLINYDWRAGVNEPDCSPYPLDVMAFYALYQTD